MPTDLPYQPPRPRDPGVERAMQTDSAHSLASIRTFIKGQQAPGKANPDSHPTRVQQQQQQLCGSSSAFSHPKLELHGEGHTGPGKGETNSQITRNGKKRAPVDHSNTPSYVPSFLRNLNGPRAPINTPVDYSDTPSYVPSFLRNLDAHPNANSAPVDHLNTPSYVPSSLQKLNAPPHSSNASVHRHLQNTLHEKQRRDEGALSALASLSSLHSLPSYQTRQPPIDTKEYRLHSSSIPVALKKEDSSRKRKRKKSLKVKEAEEAEAAEETERVQASQKRLKRRNSAAKPKKQQGALAVISSPPTIFSTLSPSKVKKSKTILVKIIEAIDSLKDRRGCTPQAIKSWVFQKYPDTNGPSWNYSYRNAAQLGLKERVLQTGSSHVRLLISPWGKKEIITANGGIIPKSLKEKQFEEDNRPDSKTKNALLKKLRGCDCSFIKIPKPNTPKNISQVQRTNQTADLSSLSMSSLKRAAWTYVRKSTKSRNTHRPSAEKKERVKQKMNALVRSERPFFDRRKKTWLGSHLADFVPFLAPRSAQLAGVRPLPRSAAPAVGDLEEQPECLKGGELRSYQLEGLNWLRNLYHWGASGILADEMGLGKTVQTIALFAWLRESQGKKGPHLVLCPLSVTEGWMREIKKWLPKARAVLFHGPPSKLQQLANGVLARCEFDICVSTYEVAVSKASSCLRGFAWRYIVLDEGHRVKNENTQCHKALANFSGLHTLLLTGTPVQNNMHELWSLLHFLYPNFFASSEPFDRAFEHLKMKSDHELLVKTPALLKPLMLRRLKRDVEATLPPKEEIILRVPMSDAQLEVYKGILMNHGQLLDELAVSNGEKEENGGESVRMSRVSSELSVQSTKAEGWKQIKALFVELRKAACHPFLLNRKAWKEAKERGGRPDLSGSGGGKPPPPLMDTEAMMRAEAKRRTPRRNKKGGGKKFNVEEMAKSSIDRRRAAAGRKEAGLMINLSGKLRVLEQLLKRLKRQKHRVLIFSCFTTVLDLLGDYLSWKGYKFLRLDGSTNRVKRRVDISRFQALGSDFFIFLISNRAGGLGINLQSADTVIHFDSDWNPQADLQAQARSHRIGQKNMVRIYRLISQDTVEERILFRAQQKLYLDAMVNDRPSIANGLNLAEDSSAAVEGGSSSKRKKGSDSTEPKGSDILNDIRFGAQRLFNVNAKGISNEDLDSLLMRAQRICQNAGGEDVKSQEAREKVMQTLGGSGEMLAANVKAFRFGNIKLAAANEFQGRVYEKKKPSYTAGNALICQPLRRRVSQSRMIKVTHEDGSKYNVLKENTTGGGTHYQRLSCFSIWDTRDHLKYHHEAYCAKCYGLIDRKSHEKMPLECGSCPKSYHMRCAPEKHEVPVGGFRGFVCPLHICCICMSGGSSRGMIFRCLGCAKAYCDEHCPRPTFLIQKGKTLKKEQAQLGMKSVRLKQEKEHKLKGGETGEEDIKENERLVLPSAPANNQTKGDGAASDRRLDEQAQRVEQRSGESKQLHGALLPSASAQSSVKLSNENSAQEELVAFEKDKSLAAEPVFPYLLSVGRVQQGSAEFVAKSSPSLTSTGLSNGGKDAEACLSKSDPYDGKRVLTGDKNDVAQPDVVDGYTIRTPVEDSEQRFGQEEKIAAEAMEKESFDGHASVHEDEEGLEYVDECSVMAYYGFKLPSNYMYVFCTPKCKRRYEDEYLHLRLPNLAPTYDSLPKELRELLEKRIAGTSANRSRSKKKKSSSKRKRDIPEELLSLGEMEVPEIDHGHFSGETVQEKLDQVELDSQLPEEIYKLLYGTTALRNGHSNYIAAIGNWRGFSLVPEEKSAKRKRTKKGRENDDIEKWKMEVTMFYEKLRRHFMQLRTETLTVLCDLVGICLCFSSRVNKNGVVSKARRRGVRTSDSREARAEHLACIFTLPDPKFMDIAPP